MGERVLRVVVATVVGLFAAVIAGSAPTGTAAAAETGFADVPPSHAHAAGIAFVAARGITTGCAPDRFCPDDIVNRGQMASFLARAFDLEPIGGSRFSDTAGNPHEPNINAVAEAGWASGREDGTFGPTEPLSRGQVASFLARAIGLEPIPGSRFDDTAGNVHEPNINAVAAAGIASGLAGGNSFGPEQLVTRGQVATFLTRALGGGGGGGGGGGRVSVRGNQLIGPDGQPLQLRGVDQQSPEYACFYGYDVIQQPADQGSIDAMRSWGINAVRLPLNEQCWLGEGGLDPAFTGAAYRSAIADYVDLLTSNGLVVILDLHWSAPDGEGAEGQDPMANADNSPTFWTQVAGEYAGNGLVLFDVFNEPYIDFDESVADPWGCWLNGCTVHRADADQQLQADTFESAGMQDLVDAVRATGATNPILVGGLHYTQDFSELLDHLPADPLGQLVASFHAYPVDVCGLLDNGCWDDQEALAAALPLVIGEFGREDCTATGIEPFLDHADDIGASYLAWVWIVGDEGEPCAYYLIDGDYNDPTPTGVGEAVRAHYLGG